jgi:hypothetical protein
MGERVGFGNSDPLRRLWLRKHTYRLGLIVGIQPALGDVLLNDREVAGGTPQRILWTPGTDPGMPDLTPPEPATLAWKSPLDPGGDGWHIVPVWAPAVNIIREAHRRRNRGDTDALDGHALLCREKVAAALGFLDGHVGITEEDWKLAGTVMAVSDRTRQTIIDTLRKKSDEKNRSRARADADRLIVINQVTTADAVKRACEAIMRQLGKLRPNGWIARSELRTKIRYNHRDYFDEAIDILIGQGLVGSEADSYQGQDCTRYRRVDP